MDFDNNKSIKKYLIIIAITIALSIVCFIIIKYKVEGEKNIPFDITKLLVISSAETEELEYNDNLYQANIIEKNDIYIALEKNEDYKKQDAIRKVTFNNFSIVDSGNIGTPKFYRPSTTEKLFDYKEEFEINDSIEYFGDLNTNLKMEKMTVSNQGGLLQLSVILNDLGKITYAENENVTSDGTLLKKLDIKTIDIRTIISFDMIIELSSGKTFKTTITLELPVGNIEEEGVSTKEFTNLDQLVFKRV